MLIAWLRGKLLALVTETRRLRSRLREQRHVRDELLKLCEQTGRSNQELLGINSDLFDLNVDLIVHQHQMAVRNASLMATSAALAQQQIILMADAISKSNYCDN